MEKKVLVYQAYGSGEILRQTGFSALSLLKNITDSDDLEIWIYTDNRPFFEKIFGSNKKIQLIDINAEQIQKWRGSIQFVHRVKIEILRDAGSRFKGGLFYSDGDTIFKESPMPLMNKVNDRTSLMHIAEGALDQNTDPLSKKILKFTKKHHFQVRNELVGIGPSTVMWNAGFIGISEKNKSLLPLILELTDQTYGLYQKHVMEQLAVSFYLQTRSTVLPVVDIVAHYWEQKNEYQKAIDQFLAENPNLEAAFSHWDHFQTPPPFVKVQKKPLFKKLFRLN